jgi:VIT1/CCC1 family predicted Fe2+/Mn2+ transporter
VAGALSMAAGAYIGSSSEAEVRATEEERRRFLGEGAGGEAGESPLVSALIVGVGYVAGALVPVLPVLFGATGMGPTVAAAGLTIIVVSAIVAFLSGMDVRRRIVLNIFITGLAVVVTYSIGSLAKVVWGISV